MMHLFPGMPSAGQGNAPACDDCNAPVAPGTGTTVLTPGGFTVFRGCTDCYLRRVIDAPSLRRQLDEARRERDALYLRNSRLTYLVLRAKRLIVAVATSSEVDAWCAASDEEGC